MCVSETVARTGVCIGGAASKLRQGRQGPFEHVTRYAEHLQPLIFVTPFCNIKNVTLRSKKVRVVVIII